MTPIECVAKAARQALLNAEQHETVAGAIHLVAKQLLAGDHAIVEVEKLKAQVEALEAQLREADIEPQRTPQDPENEEGGPLRAVEAKP